MAQRPRKLPDFIGHAVRPSELQLNQCYALVFNQDPDDDQKRHLYFHVMTEIPSQRILTTETAIAVGTDRILVFAEMLYWDADIWQIRSLTNDVVLTIARKDCELISDNPLN